jgi:hypothetical protein
MFIFYSEGIGKDFPDKSWRLRCRMECWASITTLTFGTTRTTVELSAVRSVRFTPKEIYWYSFLLEDEWTQGVLNADKIRKFENFQWPPPSIESGTAVLWRSASTNCATAHPRILHYRRISTKKVKVTSRHCRTFQSACRYTDHALPAAPVSINTR